MLRFFSKEACTDVVCHGSGGGMLFCLFEGSVLSIKRRELRLGTTSLSPSFLSNFRCLSEVRLFILPQPVAVLGVDVKVPGACGAKAMRACALLVSICAHDCLSLHL